jgi:nucleoside-diphosphate-sugar epimerase
VLAYGHRVPITIVRPPAVYGPRDTDFLLVFKAVQNGFFPYWGRCTYSLIHVEDLARGLILAAEKEEAAGKTYYLADSTVYTDDDMLAALSVALDRKVVRLRLPRAILPVLGAVVQKIQKKGIINPDKILEIRYADWTCTPDKAVRDLGFRTEIPLEEGFKITAEWYRKEKWL